jgi:hypothetical protein
MRALAILLFLLVLSCQTASNRQPPKLYGVIFRVQVSPAGKIEAFNVSSIVDPFGSGASIAIAPDWLMAACMVFQAQTKANPTPTYKEGGLPQAQFVPYLYDRDRPKAFFGKDPEKPIFFVPDGLSTKSKPAGEQPDVCDGEIGRPSA